MPHTTFECSIFDVNKFIFIIYRTETVEEKVVTSLFHLT